MLFYIFLHREDGDEEDGALRFSSSLAIKLYGEKTLNDLSKEKSL